MKVKNITESILFESQGFVAISPGDELVNPSEPRDVAEFQELITLPRNGFRYDDTDQRDIAVAKVLKKLPGKAYFLNKPKSNQFGVIIVHLIVRNRSEYYFQYTTDVASIRGKFTEIPPRVKNPKHGGYVYNGDRTLSERSGIKPSEILMNEGPYHYKEIVDLLDKAKPTVDRELVLQVQSYLESLTQGKPKYVIQGGAKYHTIHAKYLGEWAAPIALITGAFDKITKRGIETNLLGGKQLRRGLIKYPLAVNETLFDSVVVVGDSSVNISSKSAARKGASASLQGLYDAMNKRENFPPTFYTKGKTAKFYKITKLIMENNALDGILALARMESIIDELDENCIRGLVENMKTNPRANTLNKLTPKLKAMVSLYQADLKSPLYNLLWHTLAVVSKHTAAQLNDEDYSSVIKEILNHASVVQAYLLTKVKGNDLIVDGFHIVYPPEFSGKVIFDSTKNFTSTEVRGRLNFKLI